VKCRCLLPPIPAKAWLCLWAGTLACSLQMPKEADVFEANGGGSHGSSINIPSAAFANSGGAAHAGSGGAKTLSSAGGSTVGGRANNGGNTGGSTPETLSATSSNPSLDGGRGNTATTGTKVSTPELGLIAHYAFDETTGEVALNQVDGTLNGRYVGSCDHPTGRIGSAVGIRNLNGVSSDWIELPQGLLLGLEEATLSIWIRDLSTTRGGGRLFDFASGTAEEFYFSPAELNPATSASVSHIGGTHKGASFIDLWTTSAGIDTGYYSNWHHVAVAWSAANITLYIDGNSAGSVSSPAALPRDLGAATTNWLGRTLDDVSLALYAEIDDFRIYNRVLSAAEIAQLHQAS
jgi:hypothetical protein